MLYHLFHWLNKGEFKFPGSGLFEFLTFRMLLAVLLSLFITTFYGKKLIKFLQKKQIGESIREEGLPGEEKKKGTPTMGGIIIILAIIIPTLLLADLTKVYVQLMLISTVWLGIIGFIDDYLKLKGKRLAQQKGEQYKKGSNDGLAGWFKILGQVGLGITVGATLYFNSEVKIWREYVGKVPPTEKTVFGKEVNGKTKYFTETKTPLTTIPFVKDHEFNYSKLLPASWRSYTWILYIVIVIFIITAVSNGSNLTDGLDGLATGTSAIIGSLLGIFAYASGNLVHKVAKDYTEDTLEFEAIQSSNWQNMRLKPPGSYDSPLGWLLEFRCMDSPITEREKTSLVFVTTLFMRIVNDETLDVNFYVAQPRNGNVANSSTQPNSIQP